MSDKEPSISADEADDQHELTKEERLEAARKKFEEMKKKKKKSKKKKKEEGKEDTQEPEDAKEGTEEPEDTKEVTQEPEVTKEVTKEPEDAKEVDDNKGKETIAVVEPQTENVQNNSTENSEISELKAKVEEQAKTIAKLRDENTDLKLGRMDLQDKVDELEHQIVQLKSNSSSGATLSAVPAPALTTPLKPAKPVITTNDYASISQQNFKKFETTVDFRERLMIWKGWQVDMTNWNGTGAVTKVAI